MSRWMGFGPIVGLLLTLTPVVRGDDRNTAYPGSTAEDLEPGTFLCGVVWSDIDHDGIRDPGEPLVPVSTVYLLTSTGGSLYGVLTQNDGHYSIEVPGPGSYRLRFQPECYGLTTQDQGADDFLDSDANPSTRQTAIISTPFTEDDLTRWSGGLVGANGVNPPDLPVFIVGARPDAPPPAHGIFDIEDPNDPEARAPARRAGRPSVRRPPEAGSASAGG